MSVIQDVIKEEYNRLNSLLDMYDRKISECVKGSLSVKKRGGHSYYYLAYRENQKVKFVYVGKEDPLPSKKCQSSSKSATVMRRCGRNRRKTLRK